MIPNRGIVPISEKKKFHGYRPRPLFVKRHKMCGVAWRHSAYGEGGQVTEQEQSCRDSKTDTPRLCLVLLCRGRDKGMCCSGRGGGRECCVPPQRRCVRARMEWPVQRVCELCSMRRVWLRAASKRVSFRAGCGTPRARCSVCQQLRQRRLQPLRPCRW